VRQSVEDTIRGRVAELLAAQQDVKQHEFGRAIGRTGSWVSAFLAGKRHANDVRLVVKIARYFGVTVGYLLNESDRGRDAGAATLLATWDELLLPDQDVVLQLALSLRRRRDAATATQSAAPDLDLRETTPRSHSAAGRARAKKDR